MKRTLLAAWALAVSWTGLAAAADAGGDLALLNGRIYTADTDFRKFEFLEVVNPLR